MEAIEYILIPKDRIAALIGKKGADRRRIEKEGKVNLIINSKTGDVEIRGEDPFNVWISKEVVGAIGRGFSPRVACKLFKEGYEFEILNLKDYGAKTRERRAQVRARVIGTEGKIKRAIEEYTGTKISVFGKTVGIIGPYEGVGLARRAIEKILQGGKQTNALRWLSERVKNG